MTQNKLTTTNIGEAELKDLRKLARNHKLKQVEFINSAINYFKKTGINPAQEIFSPREEISKLTKRVDQVIRFLQVHEKEKLNPLVERLILLERHLSENYAQSDWDEFKKLISNTHSENKSLLKSEITQIRNEFSDKLISINKNSSNSLMLDKITIILIDLFFDALNNKGLSKSFKENDKYNFKNAIPKIRQS